MAAHQYLCPKCGVALQSAQDVAGRSVRCLSCQAVFVAVPPKMVSVPPPPRKVGPARPPERPSRVRPASRDYDDEPAADVLLPPIPRGRQVPVAAFVVGGALVVAVGLTIFLIQAYKASQAEPDQPVVQAPAKSAPAPSKPAPAPTPSIPRPREMEDQGFVAGPPRNPADAFEEDLPVIPKGGRTRPEPKPDNGPPPSDVTPANDNPSADVGLPKIPQARPPTVRPGATRPAANVPTSDDPPAAKPEPPKRDDPPAGPVGDGQIPPALLAKLKAATVFIKVQFDGRGATGSGFILQVDGDQALIATNDHVAVPRPNDGAPPARVQHEVVFHSGRKNEFSRPAELVATDAEHDLAILRVSGVRGTTDFPAALNATDPPPLSETTPIYIIGFPFGRGLATSGDNPAVTISRGTITSLREDDAGDIVFIQIDADANPGNSGGPVVDGRGRLVGVLRGGKPGTAINFAIPQAELARMLTGRVGDLEFQVTRAVGDMVEMDVRGSLIDPLDRVKSASLRVVRADALKDKPSVGADRKWAALANSQPTELRVSGRTVSARIELPVRAGDRGRIDIYFQPTCVDRNGRTTCFAPVSQTLQIVDGPGPSRPGFPGAPVGPGAGFPRGPGVQPPAGFPGAPGGPGIPVPPSLPQPPGFPGAPSGPPGFPGAPGGPPAPPAVPLPPGAGPGFPGGPPGAGPPVPPAPPLPPGAGGPKGPGRPGLPPGGPKRPGRPGK
jgi:S1-C subfamily serine protease